MHSQAILTRSTTGPVKLLFYFFSIPHRVVSEQPGIQHSKHLIFQFVQYTEYHCIRVQKIPASKSTSTKQPFLFQFYTIVNQNRNFNFGSIQIHLHVSTNRESDWRLVKFHCLPVTSLPVNHSIFRTEAFGKISLEVPPISPYRSFQPISYSVYLMFYRQLHR